MAPVRPSRWHAPLLSLLSLLLLCTLGRVTAAPDAPAMGWLNIHPTVLGSEPVAENATAGIVGVYLPGGRCSHSLISISDTLANVLHPNYEPTWKTGDDENGITWTIGLMVGGWGWQLIGPDAVNDWSLQLLTDSYLVQLSSSRHEAWADWVPLEQMAPPAELAARSGINMQFLADRDEVVAFGGQDAAGVYQSDVWSISTASGVWAPLAVAGDASSHPPGRTLNDGGWVRVPSWGAGGGDALMFFGGESLGAAPLDDLWSFNVPPTPASAAPPALPFSWSKPENLTCLQRESVCPDAHSFAALFPQLDVSLAPLLEEYYFAAAAKRPSETLAALQRLQTLTAELTAELQTPEMINYAANHSTVDGQCADVCVRDDTAAAPTPRPAVRAGHGVSLWDWTNPQTDEHVLQLVLWGGAECGLTSGGSGGGDNCYDSDLHFLDLHTWRWSVRRRPAPNPAAGPEAHWPTRRAFHSQHVYTTATSAELWVFGGTYLDRASTLSFHKDVAVYDLVAQRWFLTPADDERYYRAKPGYIEMFGGVWAPREASARQASLLAKDHLWLHGGCSADNYPIADESLWTMKLGHRITAENIRVSNDAAEWVYGQGLSHAQPGERYLPDGSDWKFNYFFFEAAENLGTNKTFSDDSEIGVINRDLVGVPATNSTPLPYWGHFLRWGSGLQARFTCLLVSAFVPGGRRSNTTNAGGLLTLGLNPGSPQEFVNTDGSYKGEYSITAGSQYELYVFFDGQDVPGSPFHLSMETDKASGRNTVPAESHRPVPPNKVDPSSGALLQQHYGNMKVARPITGGGQGLSRVIRGSTGSFLLQIVDSYLNNWIDDSNAITCLGDKRDTCVTIDAIAISLLLYDPSRTTMLHNMSLSEFNYVNNEDGTYSVVYALPASVGGDRFAMQVLVNGQRIAQGEVIVVEVVEPLQLSELQMAGMLAVSSIISAVMLAAFIFFVLTRHTARMQSRSLLFDALFTLGTLLGTLAILEQTNYSGGYLTGEDLRPYIDTHNACQLHSVLIGATVVLCFGSVYAMVERSRLIYLACRKSAAALSNPEGKKASAIVLNQELPANSNPDAPLPLIPNVPTDVQILLPVLAMLLVEFVFQAVWAGAAPMEPALAVAADGFRTYVECSGSNKQTWVYVSIALKGVMCAWFLFWSSGGRAVTDAMGEARMLAWSTYNMALTAAVATLLVFLLDSADSIKTSFIVSTFAVCWSCLLCVALVYLPRVRAIVRARNAADPFWYDSFIQQAQEEELLAKARADKEDRESKGNMSQAGNSSLGNASSLGNVSSLGSTNSGPVGAATGSLRTLRTNTIGTGGRSAASSTAAPNGAAGAKKPAALTRAIPKTVGRGASSARLSTGSSASSPVAAPSSAASSVPPSLQLAAVDAASDAWSGEASPPQ